MWISFETTNPRKALHDLFDSYGIIRQTWSSYPFPLAPLAFPASDTICSVLSSTRIRDQQALEPGWNSTIIDAIIQQDSPGNQMHQPGLLTEVEKLKKLQLVISHHFWCDGIPKCCGLSGSDFSGTCNKLIQIDSSRLEVKSAIHHPMFKSVYKHLIDIALGKTSEEHLQFPPDSHFWLLEAGRTMGDQPPSSRSFKEYA